MFGRLSARTCILSAIRLADAFVAFEGLVYATDFDGEIGERLEGFRVGAERREPFIAALHESVTLNRPSFR